MGTLIRSPDTKTVTCDVRGKNSHHNSFGKVLLLLIFKSDERASNVLVRIGCQERDPNRGVR
jgi:hypothetical protein